MHRTWPTGGHGPQERLLEGAALPNRQGRQVGLIELVADVDQAGERQPRSAAARPRREHTVAPVPGGTHSSLP